MIGNSWDNVLEEEFEKEYFLKIKEFVEEEYKTKTIYPPKEEIFNAFKLCPIDNVKVVILGQDPYHEEGQAHGLAFSTPEGHPIPRSLKNIFKEIESEYGYPIPESGCLESEGNANSHSKCGWQTFTDNVIKILNNQDQAIAFLLWGKQAELKKELIDNPNHLVLISSHPSPFSARRGFFGCNHFKLANEFLKENSLEEIDWQINPKQQKLI